MVGIVIVSHSAKAADGIKELALQMSGGSSSIEAAGGLTDGSIGTDAVRIMEAVRKVDDGDGVVILADLGSAVLSSSLALELIEEAVRERVKIADAPILEGTIIAAVQASIGDTVENVLVAAEESRSLHKKV